MIVDAFDGKHGKRQLLREKNSSAAFIKPFPSISLLGVIQRGFAAVPAQAFSWHSFLPWTRPQAASVWVCAMGSCWFYDQGGKRGCLGGLL